jgi:hypothetical protein
VPIATIFRTEGGSTGQVSIGFSWLAGIPEFELCAWSEFPKQKLNNMSKEISGAFIMRKKCVYLKIDVTMEKYWI